LDVQLLTGSGIEDAMTREGKAVPAVSAPDDAESANAWIAEIRALINEHRWTRCEIIRSIAEGRASREAIKRWAMEYHHYSTIATSNAFILLANSPDRPTYFAWGRNMAGELGYLEEPEHLTLLAELPMELGATEEQIASLTPLAATLGAAFTVSYYFRRSFEEGIAAGVASENMAVDAMEVLYNGLRTHYAIDSRFFKVHIAAEQEHAEIGLMLLGKHAGTATLRQRMGRAILNTCLTKRAMWVACEAFLQ
jgi:pyrroloquinoline quinone (PQQ) biosynthesis protein C